LMGLRRWYDNRIKSKLVYENIPRETVQRHFDIMKNHGYTGFNIRADSEVDNLFGKDEWMKKAEYRTYLLNRIGATFERRLGSFLVGIINAVT